MNPFFDPARAEPLPRPARWRGPRRYAGHLAVAASLGLGAWASAQAVDVNSASQSQLEAVRGIGPKTAAVIVQERGKGAYTSFADLATRVKGLGAKRVQKLREAGLTLDRHGRETPPVMVNIPPKR